MVFNFTAARIRVLLAALALVLAAGALALGVRPAAAQEGTTWELGDFCVHDYRSGSVCQANDVRITNISPTMQEICVGVGDHATAQFTVELVSNAQTRYDVGVFVATDGNSALSGDSCYHDFLQPGSVYGPWNVLGGSGPFYELEGNSADTCADIRERDDNGDTETTYYEFQEQITVLCTDADSNGIVDPFDTCTSWDQNAGYNCFTVKNAFPGSNAKCRCENRTTEPAILVYGGLDWGDLPEGYLTSTESNGPRHAVQNLPNTTYTPDTIIDAVAEPDVVYPAVWLGQTVDFSPDAEDNGQPDLDALGDDRDTQLYDDEDGISVPTLDTWTKTGEFIATVSTSTGSCDGCRLGYWFDWNADGDFNDQNEAYVASVVAGDNPLTLSWPTLPDSILVYARFRLYDAAYTGSILPSGLVANGEVEDYRFDLSPTEVDLLSFTAMGIRRAIVLNWETASESDNLGFNLYRANTLNGERTKINATLIPSLVPGGAEGASYEYVDSTATRRITYYYWLEAIDLSFSSSLYGPASAKPLFNFPWKTYTR